MVRIWLVAAVALVIGILIGFASGFAAAGRRNAPAGVASAPETPAESSASGRPFSEAAIPPARPALPALSEPGRQVEGSEPARQVEGSEPARRVEGAPARVDPEPVVPAAEPEGRKAASERAARVEGPGSMQIVSRPAGAQVILDGRNIGRTPLALPDVPEGTHAVRLELPGFKQWATTVEVTPGQRTRVAASLEQ